jgi:hypothetical protein
MTCRLVAGLIGWSVTFSSDDVTTLSFESIAVCR